MRDGAREKLLFEDYLCYSMCFWLDGPRNGITVLVFAGTSYKAVMQLELTAGFSMK